MDGYRADNGVDVDMTFLRGFKSGLERIKMGDNVVSLSASAEKVEDGLCSVMMRPSYSKAMSTEGNLVSRNTDKDHRSQSQVLGPAPRS